MADPNTNDPSQFQDLEMGEDSTPVVNNYQKQQGTPQPPFSGGQGSAGAQTSDGQGGQATTTQNNQQMISQINPKGDVPPVSENIFKPSVRTSAQSVPQQAAPVTQNVTGTPNGQKPITPGSKAKKKAIIGCLGAIVVVLMILLIMAFIFIFQPDASNNPIAKLLNLNQSAFINGLITLVNVVFFILGFLLFIIGMSGFFKSAMAKKEDKDIKKKGISMGVISFVLLFIVMIIWIFVFIKLDPLVIDENAPVIIEDIITDPADTYNKEAPIDIKFDASQIAYDSKKYQIIAYKWDFGDGTTGANQSLVYHTYKDKGKNDGRFDVKLSIIQLNKDTNEEETKEYKKTITISNIALSAIFTATPESGEAPLKVEFDASESSDPDGEIRTYEWDFDEDGEYDDEEGKKASYEWEKVGKYKVSLRITSSSGKYATKDMEIIVKESEMPEPVIEVVDAPEKFLTGIKYTFKGEKSTSPKGKIVKYEWDFGDNSPIETTKTATHTFEKDGTYTVTLTVTDEKDGEGEITMDIPVGTSKSSPKALLKTDPALTNTSIKGTAPFTVVFDASGSTDPDNDIVEYEWDFDGDGKIDSIEKQTSYTYTKDGIYNAKLKVIDSEDNYGIEQVVVKVEKQGIIASLAGDTLDGIVPLTVNFDAGASSYPGSSIVNYKWDFGDGSPVKNGTAQMSHKYVSIGTFTVKLQVIGADNTSADTAVNVVVREVPLAACFSSVFMNGPAPLTTSFDPTCSTGSIAHYDWTFEEGKTSVERKPTHTFDKPGVYPVTLEVSDADNNVNTKTITITVTE